MVHFSKANASRNLKQLGKTFGFGLTKEERAERNEDRLEKLRSKESETIIKRRIEEEEVKIRRARMTSRPVQQRGSNVRVNPRGSVFESSNLFDFQNPFLPKSMSKGTKRKKIKKGKKR